MSWFATQDASPDAQLANLIVLDLYAGSGAIGLEAASRGASGVIAVEADRTTAALIRRNAADLGLRVDVRQQKVATALAGPPTAADLVFADPPYPVGNDAIEADLRALRAGWLSPDALVVVERSARTDAFAWPPEFTDTWQRRYGETTLHFGTTAKEDES